MAGLAGRGAGAADRAEGRSGAVFSGFGLAGLVLTGAATGLDGGAWAAGLGGEGRDGAVGRSPLGLITAVFAATGLAATGLMISGLAATGFTGAGFTGVA